jgi:DNA-binding XRE family transcriptional regulator
MKYNLEIAPLVRVGADAGGRSSGQNRYADLGPAIVGGGMDRDFQPCPGTTSAVEVGRFGENLAFWRKRRNLSQKQAAHRLGVAKSTWSQWESGKRTPSIIYLPLLGRVFDLPWCAILSPDPGHCRRCG